MSSKIKVGQNINVGEIKLLVQGELGSGAFGTVYKVYDNTRQRTCALKQVICKNQANINAVKREANTMAKANHERVVRILGHAFYQLFGETSFLILTEFCSGGDLNTRLNRPSSQETNLKWIWQMSEALSYLHSLNPPIVHRDLKADNVLLSNQSTEDLKLGDFGLAREYEAMNGLNDAKTVQAYYMTSGIGPIHWMAPEFFRQHYTEKADVFSLGGIFYAILTRDFIQMGLKKMYGVFLTYGWQHGKVGLGYAMAFIDENAEVSFSADFQGSNSMIRLIKNMLSFDPYDRPSASEVKGHVESIRSSIRLSNDSRPSQAGGCC